MGLFSKKVVGECFFCNKEIKSLAVLLNGVKMGDENYICIDCAKEHNVDISEADKTNGAILKNIERSKELIKNGGFIASKIVKHRDTLFGNDGLLEIDEQNGLINVPKLESKLFGKNKSTPNIRLISEILDFEYMENGETITDGNSIIRGGTGGLLGLAVGGGLLGGVGAIVGAGSNNKKSKGICKSMKIKITFNDLSNPLAYIDLFETGPSCGGDLKKDSSDYKSTFETAQECISVLVILMKKNKPETVEEKVKASSSIADEILKFKQLLDMGVISQEEFDRKKMDLLN